MIIGKLVEKIDAFMHKLTENVSFHGGVHPTQNKLMSTHQPIQTIPFANRLILPLNQHIGPESIPLVQIGQQVLAGEMVARCAPPLGVPLHAPTSGTITDIGDYPVAHASGIYSRCIVLTPDGQNRMANFSPRPAPTSPQSLKAILLHSGIIGMGGAGFPSFRKIANKTGQIHTLIVNGAECEPFITCDDMLMRERPAAIIEGALMVASALGATRVLVAIEDNKPEAIRAMKAAYQASTHDLKLQLDVVQVPTIYPMGGADQLITQLTGKEVPSDGHSSDLGLIMFNVATLAAVYDSVTVGNPVLNRVVTITGFAIDKPCNILAPIGTPFEHLVRWAGQIQTNAQWLMGGPMMGVPVTNFQSPVIKTSNCILVNPPEPEAETLPCIRCGACMDACPIHLLPQQLYWHAKAGELEKLEALHLKDCIECGCCAYVCPSHIPLVQYYRHGKVAVRTANNDKIAAQHAKLRHEAQLARKASDEKERTERLAAKRAAMMAADAETQAADAPKELS